MAEGATARDTPPGADPSRPPGPQARPQWPRVLTSSVLLLVVYVLLMLAGDARAYSGSDAGGRAATVRVMSEQGTWVPDIGYWAEAFDHEGRYHPVTQTKHIGDHWVQVPSLLMTSTARPLWSIGGARMALLLPMLGAVLAAVSARGLARVLGAPSGWGAFFIVGLASPVCFYALDMWEHAPAIGFLLLALWLLLRPVPTVRTAILGGLGAGLSVALRTEMAVYLAVFVLALAGSRTTRDEWRRRPAAAASAGAVAVACFASVVLWQRAVVGSGVQASRAGEQLSELGADIGSRLKDALVTGFALLPDNTPDVYVLALAGLCGLVLLGVALRTGDGWAGRAGAILAGLAYLLRLVGGSGFVPGTFAAAPLAAAGAVNGVDAHAAVRVRVVSFTALAAMPLVWLTQWRGDLVAQWGGRYTLATGTLLTVVGAVVCEQVGWRTPAAVILVVLAAGVTAMGLFWHAERSRGMVDTITSVEDVPAGTVLVTTMAHLPREGGAFYGEHRWLVAPPGDLAGAEAIASQSGAPRVDIVQLADDPLPAAPPGMHGVGERTVTYLKGIPLRVLSYGRD